MDAGPSGDGGSEDLTHTCWRDDLWLAAFPLSAFTVLDYFALSPFYDRSCNNEKAKQQGLDPSKLHTLPPGIEYVVQDTQEPHLYVIRKQFRTSVREASPAALYYVLDGTIYQAPTLHAALLSRMKRCLYNVQTAFGIMQRDLDPLVKEQEVAASATPDALQRALDAAAAERGSGGGDKAAAVAAPAATPASADYIRKASQIFTNVLAMYPLPSVLTQVQDITAAAAAAQASGATGAGPQSQVKSEAGDAQHTAGGTAATVAPPRAS